MTAEGGIDDDGRAAGDARDGGAAVPRARPRLVVSRCLELDACRYNGALIRAPLVGALAAHVELVPVCPELEVGLGVPRDPIRLVRGAQGARLVQPSTGRDLTDAMRVFGHAFLGSLADVDGFLLKSRSPSCGIDAVKVYAEDDGARPVDSAPGMFAASVLARFPHHPVEHEGRLTDAAVRDHWLTALFAMASLRGAREGRSGETLAEVHARHELVLMACEPAGRSALGRLVADAGVLPSGRLWEAYADGFRRVLARRPSRGTHIIALRHAARCFEDRLGGAEGSFEELLDACRRGRAPREAPLEAIRGWTRRFEDSWLAGQAYLAPYPRGLLDPTDPGR
ncbi:MAG: DUF523 and DUF1722 domain-containing protein [Gemmatimonadetes bacterium]|nr:DUF523 and DUF1722 domain-containing protein [Gemmatimonadota bacterium]